MSAIYNFKDITIVIISYNSQEVIGNCIKNFSNEQKMVVVDNASSDQSINIVRKLKPITLIIQNSVNKGYGSAVNQALSVVKTKYALLINPDAVMQVSDISILHQYAEANDNAGIVIPGSGWELHLKGPNGNTFNSSMPPLEGPFCSWFASGAIWLLRHNDWLVLNGFDENIFLYSEDIDFCLRLRKDGKEIIVCPQSRAQHQESTSAPLTKEIQWRKEWNIIWSHLYVTKKHDGKLKTQRVILQLLCRHVPKMIFHGLVFEKKRFWRDLAIVNATLSYIFGRKPKRD